MLSLVVNDALEGVDIARRYPTFYRRMLADPQLRWAFLEALEILEKEKAGELEPLPDELDVDLSFLERAQPPPVIIETGPSGILRLSWERPVTYLQSLLLDAIAAPRPRYRAFANVLQDERLTLVEDTIAVVDEEMGVLLEAVRPAGAPNDIHLSLLLMAEGSWRATLEWGSFRETAVVQAFDRVTFPPVPLADVVDKVGKRMAALRMTVEPAAP